jgi:hypothetical protein
MCLFAAVAALGVHGARSEQNGPSGRTDSHAEPALFAHSSDCLACHNQLVAPSGEDVSIGLAWRSTMMANAARDPYWHASVRRETIDHPRRAADIQDECAACHMPMAQRLARAAGRPGEVFAQLPFSDRRLSPDRELAADGVSCTVCHQIAAEKLGTPESFNARFVVAAPVNGVRQIQGPYAIDAGRRRIMRSVTGYEPVEAPHVKQSELCASCHTLITEAFGPNGEVVGRLPEQMNYQEWRHSAFYQEGRSCQSCHMPRADGPVRIASVLGEYRDSLAEHAFVGGNTFMLRIFARYGGELGVAALPSELDATIRATLRQLQQDTARVSVQNAGVSGSTLAFEVDVRNLAGHKFPTGYPARRTWLHVTVTDGGGRVLFESGGLAADGSIAGNDADADAGRFEPHYTEITSASDVQIYETILGDPARRPTTGLLTATSYLKDNRLLPRGFDKRAADADIAVAGEAVADPDFSDGGDRVRYRVAVGASGGPFTIDVELAYQPIAFRWARNLDRYDALEPERFLSYYAAMAGRSAEVVARALTVVPQ